MSRYYDPEIGQFISMDTVAYLKPDTIGGVDLYAYCKNDPIMYVDPSGHKFINWGAVSSFFEYILVVTNSFMAGIALNTFHNIEKYNAMLSQASKISEITQIVGYIAIGLDSIVSIICDIMNGVPFLRALSDAVVDAGISILSMMMIGAIAGSLAPGPGNLVGLLLGLAVGIATYLVDENFPEIRQTIKNGFYDIVQFAVSEVERISESIANFFVAIGDLLIELIG